MNRRRQQCNSIFGKSIFFFTHFFFFVKSKMKENVAILRPAFGLSKVQGGPRCAKTVRDLGLSIDRCLVMKAVAAFQPQLLA